MKRTFINIILPLLFFAGCKSNNEKPTNQQEFTKEVFLKREQEVNNRLFMDFWFGMNNKEFEVIRDSLLKTRSLSLDSNALVFKLTFYSTGEFLGETTSFPSTCKLKLIPNFESDSLISIRLFSNSEGNLNKVKDLYNQKYGMPKVEKSVDRYLAREPQSFIHDLRRSINEIFEPIYYDNYFNKITHTWRNKGVTIELIENYSAEEDPYTRGSIQVVNFKLFYISYFKSLDYDNKKQADALRQMENQRRVEDEIKRQQNQNLNNI